MKISDVLIGMLAIVAGVSLIVAASSLRQIPGQLFGSRFFPTVVGAAVIIIGVLLFIQGLRQWRQNGALVMSPDWFRDVRGFRILAMVAAPIVFIVFSEYLGFVFLAALLLTAMMLILGTRPLTALLTSVFSTFILYVVFAVLLRVPLPRGLAESFLF